MQAIYIVSYHGGCNDILLTQLRMWFLYQKEYSMSGYVCHHDILLRNRRIQVCCVFVPFITYIGAKYTTSQGIVNFLQQGMQVYLKIDFARPEHFDNYKITQRHIDLPQKNNFNIRTKDRHMKAEPQRSTILISHIKTTHFDFRIFNQRCAP